MNHRDTECTEKALRASLCVAVVFILHSSFFILHSPAQGVISTAAGATWVFRGDGGPALSAPLGVVSGVAADSSGNFYVTDAANHMVFKVSASGTLSVLAGNGIQWFSGDGGPGSSASVNTPTGVVVDAQGNVYFADTESHRIRRISPSGIITTVAGGGRGGLGDGGPATGATLAFPRGVALDRAGNIYIADRWNHRIRRVDTGGTITTVAGTGTAGFSGDGGPATSAQLSEPHAVALDAAGNLYIADSVNARIRRVASGTITTVAGDPVTQALSFPIGVAVDSAGNIYIAEQSGHRVRRVSGGAISTIAGTGTATFAGDGGPAANASLNGPTGIALDAAGNLLISDGANLRIRRIAGATINTVAGNGFYKYSGDGSAATSASLNLPAGVAADAAGNFYIADFRNHRVRRVSAAGIITTVAGTGVQGFSGDGGPATGAMLNEPRGVALDAAGNVYIADAGNGRLRRVSPSGVITTIAGGGTAFPGDGGPATSAQVSPWAVALDTAGNLYIADRANHRIRKITGGVITTVAGGGTVYPGDGGPATAAAISNPAGVVVDAAGNIFFTDTLNNRVRRVTPGGTISTVAGNGTFGFSGDGGPATAAMLAEPAGVALDAAGNLYITDPYNGRIRRLSGAIITTAVGGSSEQFAGDGGPATSAGISLPNSVALDAAGNIFIADTGNDRVRKVLAARPTFSVSPPGLSFSAAETAVSVVPQQIGVGSNVSGLAWTAQATTESGGPWLSISPASGSVPGSVTVTVNVAGLAQGSYRGRITLESPLAVPSAQTVVVDLVVRSATPPQLAVEPASFSFEARAGATASLSDTLRIANSGSGSIAWTARADTTSGGSWLGVAPLSGTAVANAASAVQVTANPGGLAAGVYSGSIRVESAALGQAQTVSVTLLVSQVTQVILLSQSGLLFTGVEGGGVVPSQSFGVVNAGQGAMNWTVRASTLAGGSWLTVTPASGRSDGGGVDVPQVQVAVNATGLRAGAYSGLIQIDAPGASNSPQFVTVELSVLPAGVNPGVLVRPTGLIFATQAGSSPGSQTVRLSSALAGGLEARSGVLTGDGGNWLQVRPGNVAITAPEPGTITVQPFTDTLVPGVYRGALTLLFLDGSPPQVVSVLLIVVPRTTGAASALGAASSAQCAPQRLHAAYRTLGGAFNSPVGWPTPIEVQVLDDCGNPVTNANVVASFSNGDSPLVLASLAGGIYTGTWRPVNAAAAQVVVTTRADRSGLAPVVIQAQGLVRDNPTAPALFPGGIVSGASFARGGAVAPGSIVSVFGRNMASGQSLASRLPLDRTLGGATLSIGGRDVPLFFASNGQINAQVPFEAVPATRPQALLRSRRDGTGPESAGVPETITIAAAQPSIFTANQQGTGQGAILNAQAQVVDSSAPARAGDVVQVFCTGLGATNPPGRTGEGAPPAEPLARVVAAVTATVGGRAATVHFAGLAPGFVGLYQVNVEIPAGVEPGSAVPLVLSQSGVPSNTVTLATR